MHIPFNGTLKMLKNLKRLEVFEPLFLSHEGLLPLVIRPNFAVQIVPRKTTNISADGFQKIVQVGLKMIAFSVTYRISSNRTPGGSIVS